MYSTPCISYRCASAVASGFYGYKQMLRYLDEDHFMLVPPTCSCSLSSFGCGPAGRVVAGYVGVVGDENLK